MTSRHGIRLYMAVREITEKNNGVKLDMANILLDWIDLVL